MVGFTLESIVVFIAVHVAFGLVSKFILKRIDIVFYLLLIVFFVVYFYGVNLSDVQALSAAIISSFQ